MKSSRDERMMRMALRLARRGLGTASPNPMVGAVLVKGGKIIGLGWHRRAGQPHAEIEALRDAAHKGHATTGATLYVTLEPCSTHGRTPPCTDAVVAARVWKVVAAATDPNPAHRGKGFRLLRRKGIAVETGVIEDEALKLNEAFNHWIVHRTPYVTVKSAMTLDGKIATAGGESKWITGAGARARGMRLRAGADAILAGVNTVLADDPQLTWRPGNGKPPPNYNKRRIILDTSARTPLTAKVVSDEWKELTTIVVGKSAPARRVAALARRVNVITAPERAGRIDLRWLLAKLGREQITSLLVEGGGEVNSSFLLGGWAHRVEFFYAPKILGGGDARKAVAGVGVRRTGDMLRLAEVEWKWIGPDLFLSAKVVRPR